MPRTPPLVAAAVVAATAAWALRMASTDSPFSGGAAALLAFDALLLAVVVIAGLLIARARWARRSAGGLLLVEAALLPALPADGWNLAVLMLVTAAFVAVTGPWLEGWVRKMPRAGGPSERIVVLVLGMLAVPGAAALTAPGGLEWGHVVLAIVAIAAGWAFGRALPAGLWAARLVLPAAGIVAALQSRWFTGLALAAFVATLTALSWTRESSLAIHPLVPLRAATFRIPPQLAPPEVLSEAGLDEHGRPAPRS